MTTINDKVAHLKQRLKHYLIGDRQELETYKHAFETTAADRDRLAQALDLVSQETQRLSSELKTYRAAFETTAADRDSIGHQRGRLATALLRFIREPQLFQHLIRQRPLPSTPKDAGNLFELLQTDSEKPTQTYVDELSGLRVPNVFCVGAPKSATSFLYSILREHPLIHVGDKDIGSIRNLLYDLQRTSPGARQTGFRRFILGVNKGYNDQPVFCNFEAGFFIYPTGATLIANYLDPNALVLIFLRDPVERAISDYVMRVRQYDADLKCFVESEDFHTALALDEERKAKDVDLYNMYYAYTEMSKYHDLVQRYVDEFGPTNVKVVSMEQDMIEDLPATLLDIFSFLGIKDVEAISIAFSDHKYFKAISSRPTEIKMRFLCKNGQIYDDTKPIADLLRVGVARIEIGSNVSEQLDMAIDGPTDDDVRAAATLKRRHGVELTLQERRELFERHFRGDVQRLERLLGRDLAGWYDQYA